MQGSPGRYNRHHSACKATDVGSFSGHGREMSQGMDSDLKERSLDLPILPHKEHDKILGAEA